MGKCRNHFIIIYLSDFLLYVVFFISTLIFFVCGFVFVLSLYAVFFVCGIALIGTQSRVNFWWPAFEAGGPAVLGEKVCALMKT